MRIFRREGHLALIRTHCRLLDQALAKLWCTDVVAWNGIIARLVVAIPFIICFNDLHHVLLVELPLPQRNGDLGFIARVVLETVCFPGHGVKPLCAIRYVSSGSSDQFQIDLGAAFAGSAWSYNLELISILGVLNSGPEFIVDSSNSARVGFTVRFEAICCPAFLQAICCALHCLQSSHPRRFIGCGIADGKEILERAFFVATAGRSSDVRGASQCPSIQLSTILPLVVHNVPEFGRIAQRWRHGNRISRWQSRPRAMLLEPNVASCKDTPNVTLCMETHTAAAVTYG